MQKDIYILNVETSTKNCSVSIGKNGKTIALHELCEANFSHAEKLPEFINKAIADAKITFKDLSAVAVSKGPGSYTGLRIGVSSAKGLSFGLDIPLLAIESLEILAKAVANPKGYLIPLLDARRHEVYTAVYNANYKEVTPTFNHILEENSFAEYLTKNTVFFLGDGADKTKEIVSHKNAVFLKDYHPSAKEMTVLSYQKFLKNQFEDVAYFEPFYLKDFYVTPAKKKNT